MVGSIYNNRFVSKSCWTQVDLCLTLSGLDLTRTHVGLMLTYIVTRMLEQP